MCHPHALELSGLCKIIVRSPPGVRSGIRRKGPRSAAFPDAGQCLPQLLIGNVQIGPGCLDVSVSELRRRPRRKPTTQRRAGLYARRDRTAHGHTGEQTNRSKSAVGSSGPNDSRDEKMTTRTVPSIPGCSGSTSLRTAGCAQSLPYVSTDPAHCETSPQSSPGSSRPGGDRRPVRHARSERDQASAP